MKVTQLSPHRPYLLRAFYEWLLDNRLTPHIVVDINVDGVIVPIEFASDGHIVLNIAPQAVANLALGNYELQFDTSFNGRPRQVLVPIAAVLAIYARENGAGTIFEPDIAYKRLALVDDDSCKESTTETVMSVIDGTLSDQPKGVDSDDVPRGGGRAPLRVVK